MKGDFKNNFFSKWTDIMSKLSNPVTTKHRLFSYEAAQLVFILITFFIISDFTNFIEFSQTILGRIIVVIVLLYDKFWKCTWNSKTHKLLKRTQ